MEKFKNNLIPKVSVVIPTYNRPQLVAQAIQSVLNQTYNNFEVIIIDDSPDDKTEKVINNLNDKRIKYIRNKLRGSYPRARNQGVKESDKDSKYIANLDDDDQFLPLFLKRTIKRLEDDQELAAVTTSGETQLPNGEVIDRGEISPPEFWRRRIGTCWVIRKEIFLKENFWYDDEMFFEDLDFGIRVAKTHKVEEIPEILKVRLGYPLHKGESASTVLTASKDITLVFRKNQEIFQKAGKKAESWIHYMLGTALCKGGKLREGRDYLKKGFLIYPDFKYFFYYLLALFYPKVFLNMQLTILKHKIFRKRLKLGQKFMETKKLLLSILKQIRKPFAEKGLGRIPVIKQIFSLFYKNLKPFDGIGLIELPNYKIYVNSCDVVGRSIILGETWEPYFTEILQKEVREGMTAIDLGAFIGLHALYLAKLVGPKGKVFAFEPHPYNYNLFLKSIEANEYNNIIAIQKAVSDKIEKTTFFIDPNSPYGHTIYDPKDGWKSVEVETITLDEFFKDKDNKVNIIKMDIEGAEMAALQGMKKILKKNRKLRIFTEFYPKRLESAGCYPEDFLNELKKYGFKLFNINEEKKKLESVNVSEWMGICKQSTNLLCLRD